MIPMKTRCMAYDVTGVDRDGRRFRRRYSTASDVPGQITARHMAFGINLWRGSVWMVHNFRPLRRTLVKRTYN